MLKKFKTLLLSMITIILSVTLVACGNSNDSKKSNNDKENIQVTASVNFYADVAKAVLGNNGQVNTIIDSNIDPHDFEPTTGDAKTLAKTDVAIQNGLGYDGWMNNLIKNTSNVKNNINVGTLMNKKNGDNPHIWYNPETMNKLADKLATSFSKIDPKHKNEFKANANKYKKEWQKTTNLVNKLKKNSHGKAVATSEPVFDYSLTAMGYKFKDNEFAHAMEHGIDPSAKEIAEIQNDIKNHKVAFFVNNSQVQNSVVEGLVKLAKKNNVPVVNVTESAPKGKNYMQWMQSQYKQVEKIQNNHK
ncbi:zinc ABC transporter solute-binding protein [Lactobacillus sp. S2-2]|uniref:metal ABC transporter solute-binding protein, Zn/Mn family n=1 Tax=Lactobacillus sp. S2-2 TaxID=2692917 RepID=UPI001F3389D4|nr:zinc ABC transporter substrate-binding protein [Lactobacillus sp. S2-2]MCF6515193.1 zinc ABC transporter solute-binding protein [Lactobacillus sp. S2-2]